MGTYCNGVLCGTNFGTISTCYATGQTDINYFSGGLIGKLASTGTISNCYANVTLSNDFLRLGSSSVKTKGNNNSNEV
ncbi:MAG: hypothetical protein IPG89_06700 [Bacteroidetes bacterium]|nr:hypothetical protein [Bacteroidota bacterium]